jgi:hypothetical protein
LDPQVRLLTKFGVNRHAHQGVVGAWSLGGEAPYGGARRGRPRWL